MINIDEFVVTIANVDKKLETTLLFHIFFTKTCQSPQPS